MKINPTTQCFEDLSPQQADELLETCRQLVLNGLLPSYGRPYYAHWLEVVRPPHPTGVLILNTAFPQRALLSVALYYRGQLNGGPLPG